MGQRDAISRARRTLRKARLDAAKRAAEAAGGKMHAWYLTMGKYDAVIISEFSNDEASEKFMLFTGSMGSLI
jgi:uncharacterized protein with GYD domain